MSKDKSAEAYDKVNQRQKSSLFKLNGTDQMSRMTVRRPTGIGVSNLNLDNISSSGGEEDE